MPDAEIATIPQSQAVVEARAAGARRAAARASWREELSETVKLAAPMAATQLGQIAMMTTDLALLGRLGDHVVAAAALAHTVVFAAFTLGLGLVSAVAPLASQAFGARKPRLVRRSVRVGLWAALVAGVPLTAVQFRGADMLLALGQPPESAALAGRYLAGLAWCLIPGWAFIALRNFMSAVNRPEPALWITLAAIPLNGVLAYALIHGAFGAPRLDILGAGVATSVVNLAMCVAAVWLAYGSHPFKKYRVLGRFWRPDWALLRQLLIVGIPISGAFLLEFGMFAAAALLMGHIGPTALAAHAIALQTAAILFMVPFGISLAATVRVGQAAGRRDAGGTRRAGIAAIGLAAAFMAVMTLLVAIFRHAIPSLFLGAEAAAETAALAATLLALGATFFLTDGIQTVAAGALRGLNDTRVPLAIAAFSYWIAGFAVSYVLAFPVGLGAIGVWIGLSIGTTAFAALLVWRFHALTHAGYMPAAPDSA
ncbi:MAG: MATE family efflux transporter [Hyphomicrobiaceae bacterium]